MDIEPEYVMQQQTAMIGYRACTLAAALVLTAGAVTVRADVCGDLNGDGRVDMNDGGLCIYDVGCSGGDCVGDVDGDGDTDQQDLAWFLTYFGCDWDLSCGPCEPIGDGTIDVDLVAVDNTDIGAGGDPGHPEFDGGVTHFTFDLAITVTVDNYWTTQWSSVELVHPEVAFFNHDFGTDTEPNSAIFGTFPALEFDSFFAAPPELFGNVNPGFASNYPQWTDVSVKAIWFCTPHEEDYTATIQRFTLVVPEDSGMVPTVHADDCQFEVLARVNTDATAASTGADLLHSKFVIVDLAQPLCPEDVDGDGHVGQSDLGILLTTYERSPDDPLYDDRADVNCDGAVDQSDLGLLLAVYGMDC